MSQYLLPNVWPFQHVFAVPEKNNRVRVLWGMAHDFSGARPWRFQVQVNYYGGDPDRWENLGNEYVDVFEAEETISMPVVKNVLPIYRVRLSFSPPSTTYYSGWAVVLPMSSQLQMQGVVRRLLLQRWPQPTRRGILLKRKLNGQECTACIDPLTKQPTKSDCTECFGTGIVGGYWIQDNPNVIFLSEFQSISDVTSLGHVDPIKRQCIFVGLPQPLVGDIWVDTTTNRRYIVRDTVIASSINDVPVVTKTTLGLLASGDIAYKVPL